LLGSGTCTGCFVRVLELGLVIDLAKRGYRIEEEEENEDEDEDEQEEGDGSRESSVHGPN
jgi:hypothetical protein